MHGRIPNLKADAADAPRRAGRGTANVRRRDQWQAPGAFAIMRGSGGAVPPAANQPVAPGDSAADLPVTALIDTVAQDRAPFLHR